MLAELALLVASFIGSAMVSGLVYSSDTMLTEVRVGPSIVYAVQLVGVARLGVAAWGQVRIPARDRIRGDSTAAN